MIKIQFIVFLLLVCLISCQEQDLTYTPVEYDFGYFPIDSGIWRQYDVTTIIIDAPSERYDTSKYQLLEVYSGWYLNAANDSILRLARYIRQLGQTNWTDFQVWQVFKSGNDIIQTEENIKYIKMKFPVKLNASWNGDSYNRLDTLQEFSYTYTQVDLPEVIGNLSFDSVTTITQKDYSTKFDKIYKIEKYAYQVGLVEKQDIDIYSNDIDFSVPIEQRVTRGTQYYYKITDYGKN